MKSNNLKVVVRGSVNVGTIGFVSATVLKTIAGSHFKTKEGAKDGKHPKPFYKTERY